MPGSVVQGVAAIKGSKIQAKASRDAAQIVADIFKQSRKDQLPQVKLGRDASDFLRGLFFDSGPSAEQFGEGFNLGDVVKKFDPTFDFRLNEGLDAAQRSRAAKGSLFSGGTLRRLSEIGQSVALGSSENFLNRLGAFSGSGQIASANIGAQGVASGGQQAGFIQDAGTARASGLIGAANALASGQQRFENNNLALIGAGAGAAGSAGGALAAFCAIAQEVYGLESPKWEQFRTWLFREAPVWLFRWYGRNQYSVAAWLKGKPRIKRLVRFFMDRVI